jgi:methionyl aminopeptidase
VRKQLYNRGPSNIIKDEDLKYIEKACRIVADTLSLIEKYIKPGIKTIEIDKIAEDYILSCGAKPAFKGYRVDNKSFPNTLCISIDEQVVHGIPDNRELKEGDIVSVDCGAVKDGFYGDSAFTYPVGTISEEKQRLLNVTLKALEQGIGQALTSNKVYDISRAVQEFVEKNGFSVTRELVGHGIGRHLHEEPSIPNFVPPLLHRNSFPNIKLQKGMAIAIEPMVHAGTKDVITARDGWTVSTKDGKPAAHFEHTVIVDDFKPIILTLRN